MNAPPVLEMYFVAQLCPILCILMNCCCQAPLSLEFFRKDYWGGLPFPTPEDLSDPEIELASLLSPALPGRFFTTRAHPGSPC